MLKTNPNFSRNEKAMRKHDKYSWWILAICFTYFAVRIAISLIYNV